MKTIIIALVSGTIFGLGLSISEMIQPQRVIGFLDITGNWDATLLFVMASALIVSFPCFNIRLLRRPVFAARFDLPAKCKIDKNLLMGSSIFGVGWGLAGLCPGPAIAALAIFSQQITSFVIAMIVGQAIIIFIEANTKPKSNIRLGQTND